jgi:hypothetical protein
MKKEGKDAKLVHVISPALEFSFGHPCFPSKGFFPFSEPWNNSKLLLLVRRAFHVWVTLMPAVGSEIPSAPTMGHSHLLALLLAVLAAALFRPAGIDREGQESSMQGLSVLSLLTCCCEFAIIAARLLGPLLPQLAS